LDWLSGLYLEYRVILTISLSRLIVISLYSADPAPPRAGSERGKSTNNAQEFVKVLNSIINPIVNIIYRLTSFQFLVFEILPSLPSNSMAEDRAILHGTEQLYLDSLKLRYNILPTVGSTLGYKHTTESIAKMRRDNNPVYGRSEIMNPMFGRTGEDHPMYGVTGADHPNFGKIPANAKTVFLYNLELELVREFTSITTAAD
jgi:hypothetical protein